MARSRSTDGRSAERPKAQAPAAQAPAAQASAVEPPAVEPPAVEPPAVEPPAVEAPAVEAPAAPPHAVPQLPQPRLHSRLSAAWAGIWTAAVVFIALIVFMLQNTRTVQVSFFGFHGTLPLAMALLIAMVGGIFLTLVFGTARITQLRRIARRSRRSDHPAATAGHRADAVRK
jgi:uncharacterized integral membrane protein